MAAIREVDLRDVTGNDHFGAKAQAGQEHFHLFRRGVLRLVQNDEAVVQCPSAHISQRGNLDVAALHIPLIGFRP